MAGKKIRMILDASMTVVSVVLMGGTYFFPWAGGHEILGMALFCLWAVHVFFNRRWYGALFKGSYNPYRIMQAVINCAILVCALFLMMSGIMLSELLMSVLPFNFNIGFARTAHLLSSHWYFLFMSLHIGLHVSMIASRIRGKAGEESPRKTLVMRIVLGLVCAYGIFAFILRKFFNYIALRQLFFFFDFERGYILYFVDYISIIVLFAAISHYLARFLQKRKR